MTESQTPQAISLTAVKSALSDLRFAAYRMSPNETDETVLGRYRWNIALGMSFYPSLSLLEVTLRNNLHRVIANHYGTDAWYDLPASKLRSVEQDAIRKAKAELEKNKKPEEPGRLIAELSFGFWAGLLRPDYEQQIWHRNGMLGKAFPYLLPNRERTRAKIANRLQQIRLLRNRISHHEPIFQKRNLAQLESDVQETIRWLSPPMLQMLPVGESFREIHARGPAAYVIPISDSPSTPLPPPIITRPANTWAST